MENITRTPLSHSAVTTKDVGSSTGEGSIELSSSSWEIGNVDAMGANNSKVMDPQMSAKSAELRSKTSQCPAPSIIGICTPTLSDVKRNTEERIMTPIKRKRKDVQRSTPVKRMKEGVTNVTPKKLFQSYSDLECTETMDTVDDTDSGFLLSCMGKISTASGDDKYEKELQSNISFEKKEVKELVDDYQTRAEERNIIRNRLMNVIKEKKEERLRIFDSMQNEEDYISKTGNKRCIHCSCLMWNGQHVLKNGAMIGNTCTQNGLAQHSQYDDDVEEAALEVGLRINDEQKKDVYNENIYDVIDVDEEIESNSSGRYYSDELTYLIAYECVKILNEI